MDEKDLSGAPAGQPDDPFGGDSAVSAEYSEAEHAEKELQTEQTVFDGVETEEAQPQPQPAAEAATEAVPAWKKTVELITVICIAAAGLLSALFMCLLSVKSFGNNLMMADIASNLNAVVDALEANGNSFEGMDYEVAQLFVNLYAFFCMLGGVIAGIVFGIILIVKLVKKYALKKYTAIDKTAITAVLFFFSFALVLLSLVISSKTIGSAKICVEYGDATLAGLIICGILFAAYFILKIAINYKSYLGDRTKLINGCFNLGWAVVAMLVFAMLSCAPVSAVATQGGVKYAVSSGFNQICSDAMGDIVGLGGEIPDEIMGRITKRFVVGGLGIILQIWFIFQSGKSLHGAMRGTVSADETVKLGTQIWRLVFAVLYLIISIVLTKDQIEGDSFMRVYIGAPVAILVFAVIGLVLAIVNKIVIKERRAKTEI